MKCKNCNSEMVLDDRNFNFKGNYDNYWLCDNCGSGCIEKVRFGRLWKLEWSCQEE